MRQPLAWSTRIEAPLPAGVVAAGATAKRLLARLADQAEQELGRLSAVATRDMLVLIGAAEALPWVDGVRYCAPDSAVPGLWLPTHVMPRWPADLVQAAIASRVKRNPVLLWHEPEHILPLDRAAGLTPALLAWLAGELD